MRSSLFALAAYVASVSAASQGFNYGSTKADGSFMYQADFQNQFETAKNLVGTSGFTSARLYTMVQGGASTPTEAIPAAISAGTTLLLGMWASGGQASMTAEINALKSAITTYGTAFTSIVTGISVGSEDLYRNSPTGIAAGSNVGAEPETIVNYIAQVRAAIAGTGLSSVGIGHVDTWTAWNNGSNQDVVSHVDWVGVDAYPYFQNTEDNSIEQGAALFQSAMDATTNMAQGKPVWITETGWPVSGPTGGSGVPSLQNAKAYWDAVGCPRFGGSTNIYWFTLTDAPQVSTSPSFGIVGAGSSTPLYDLSCSKITTPSSTPSSAAAPQTSSITGGESTSPVATSAVVTGGGLSPTVGNGIGSQSIVPGTATSATSAASVPTGSAVTESASGSAAPSPSVVTESGSVVTLSTSSIAAGSTATTGSGSSTAKTTAPTSATFSGSGAQATGSFFGLVGAAIAVAAAL